MPAKSAFSAVGLAHKVCLSAEEQGYTPELINALAEHPTLFRDMLQVQLGLAEIAYPEHLINCDANPFVPEGWSVAPESDQISSRVRGSFKWDPATVRLYLSDRQRDGKAIGGYDLRKELTGKPVLNANVLDYLLAHPHLIHEEWKDKWIYFWGTIYRDPRDDLVVRFLCRDVGRYDWDCLWLDDDWHNYSPVALGANI